MATLALWSQLLLLGLGSVGLASPIDGSQKVLHTPETLTKFRKLNGRFLHITGMHSLLSCVSRMGLLTTRLALP